MNGGAQVPATRLDLPHVVVIGAGFGGLEAVRQLKRAPVRITLIDRRNHHLFQPLLYQVATGGLAAPDIAATTRHVVEDQENVTVLLAEVEGIEPEHRRIRIAHGAPIEFDFLIVATGSVSSYFGHDEWAPYAPSLKSLPDAMEIRSRVLTAFERAELEEDPEERQKLLTFVVVGGGPTGVELAGALAEIARHTMADELRRVDASATRVVLVEGARLLGGMSEAIAERAKTELEARGVEVRLQMVETIDEDGVIVKGGERIEARTVMWAAGVAPSPLVEDLGVELEKGRVRVEPDLSVPGRPYISVIGDLMMFEQDGQPIPWVAQVALQSGRHAARNIRRRIEGEATQSFHYKDKGQLATIGRSMAVGQIGDREVAGFWAWLIAWGVHIFWLIGFKNRLSVMLGWIWAYVSWNRSARIIYETPKLPGNTTGAETTTSARDILMLRASGHD